VNARYASPPGAPESRASRPRHPRGAIALVASVIDQSAACRPTSPLQILLAVAGMKGDAIEVPIMVCWPPRSNGLPILHTVGHDSRPVGMRTPTWMMANIVAAERAAVSSSDASPRRSHLAQQLVAGVGRPRSSHA